MSYKKMDKMQKLIALRRDSGERFRCDECTKEVRYILRTGQSTLWHLFYCQEHAQKVADGINRSVYWMEDLDFNTIAWEHLEPPLP